MGDIPRLHFEEGGRLVSSGSPAASPADAAAAGAALAYACACGKNGGCRILTAHSAGEGAAALAHAFAAGAASAGAECVFAGECCAPAAAFAAKKLGCDAGCHVHTEITAAFGLFAGDGLPLYRGTEESAEKLLYSSKELPYSHFGRITRLEGAEDFYCAEVSSLLSAEMKGFYADPYSSSPSVMRVCGRVLAENGCRGDRGGGRVAFRISSDGRRVSAYTEETGYIFADKLILLCCERLFRQGRDAAVCGKAPRALEKLAGRYGRRIISCGKSVCVNENSPSRSCLEARRAASEQTFMYDGIALMMTVLDILAREEKTLAEAVAELPEYAGICRYIPVNKPSELLRQLCAAGAEDSGLVSDSERGRVTIRPVRTDKGVMLCVESFSAETASELCDLYAGIIEGSAQPQEPYL